MADYNKENLRETLEKIDRLAHKAKMELREVENENERILKMLKDKKTNYSEKILTGTSNLIGRTIKRVYQYSKSFSSSYLLIECEDGQRVIIIGDKSENIRQPNLSPEEMIDSGFYTDEEVNRKIEYRNAEKKREEEEKIEEKQRKLEKLKKELGEREN